MRDKQIWRPDLGVEFLFLASALDDFSKTRFYPRRFFIFTCGMITSPF